MAENAPDAGEILKELLEPTAALAHTPTQQEALRLRLECPGLDQAIKALLERQLKEARDAKNINRDIRRWLARGMWPLFEAKLTTGGRTTTKEEIRAEITHSLNRLGFKVKERAVRGYTKGLGRTR